MKTMVLISCAVMIYAIVFTYAISRIFQDMAHLVVVVQCSCDLRTVSYYCNSDI